MSKPAAQLAGNLLHGPPTTGVGSPTVYLGGRPAWRVADQHTCPIPNAPPPAGPGTPHAVGITSPPGAPSVLVYNMPLVALGDRVMEPGAVVPPLAPNPIMMGAVNVLA